MWFCWIFNVFQNKDNLRVMGSRVVVAGRLSRVEKPTILREGTTTEKGRLENRRRGNKKTTGYLMHDRHAGLVPRLPS
jgi:hypothetical protein